MAEKLPTDRVTTGMTAKECRAECAKLIEFFRGEGAVLGQHGDDHHLTPAETAIYFMRAAQQMATEACRLEIARRTA